jgi:hypothetical protein
MRFRGGPVGDPDATIEVDAPITSDAARLIAAELGLDGCDGMQVWTELVDAGRAILPSSLYARRVWRVDIVRTVRMVEVDQ